LRLLSFIPVLLVFAWLFAEMKGRKSLRIVVGLAALVAVAIVAFLWGGFAEALGHMEFLVPHDSPADTALMEGASGGDTNSASK